MIGGLLYPKMSIFTKNFETLFYTTVSPIKSYCPIWDKTI